MSASSPAPASGELPEVAVVDIDGTLLDSNYHHVHAWARAFEAAGRPVPLWRLHRAIGMGGDRLVAHVTDEETEERLGDRVRERWEAEFDEIIDETRLFDGARELLDGLADAGLRVVLASSSIPKHAEHPLRLLRAEERSAGWTTSEDAEESKPDPELIDRALAKVGTDRAMMIGDSVWDVVAARERGIPTIGLLAGGFGHDELVEAGAATVRDDAASLLADLTGALAEAVRSAPGAAARG